MWVLDQNVKTALELEYVRDSLLGERGFSASNLGFMEGGACSGDSPV